MKARFMGWPGCGLRCLGRVVRTGARAGTRTASAKATGGATTVFAITARCAAVAVAGLLALQPASTATGANLLALLDTSELYDSADGGVTWTARAAIPASDAVGIMAETMASRLFLITATGITYLSTDAGTTWNVVGAVPASDVVDLAIRANGGVLALTRTGTVWESLDQGATFGALGTSGVSDATALASATNGDLHAVTETGLVWRSADGGATWTAQSAIAVSDAVTIRRAGGPLYVMTHTGTTYRSDDDGVTWNAVGTLSQVNVVGMSSDTGQVVAATQEGLIGSSNDSGSTWSWVGTVNQLRVVALSNDEPQAVDALAVLPNGFYFAAPGPNPFYTTSDGVLLQLGLPRADVVHVRLYDGRGRLVAQRAPEAIAERRVHVFRWQPGALPSGTYFLRVSTERGFNAARRLTVLR